ncbi:MAG TPA: hypothetical protein VGP17_06960 [Solirubrobacteraceae bacterium]|jgi:hypothetical protein|nr:hypothetical protein [Solirubrobacteraceae bacterium]
METDSVEPALRGRLDTQRTEALLGGYGRLKPSVLASLDRKLRRVGLQLDPGDLEHLYDLAWQVLHARLRNGEWLDGKQAAFEAFLVQVAFRCAVKIEREARTPPVSA